MFITLIRLIFVETKTGTMKTTYVKRPLVVILLLLLSAATYSQSAKIMDATLRPSGALSIYMTAATGISTVIVRVGTEAGDSSLYHEQFTVSDFTVTADNVLVKNIGTVPSGSFATIIVTLSSGDKQNIDIEAKEE